MVAALGATFLGSLDALMVTTALPTAAQDIGGVGLIAVTVGAYTVTVAMTFPVAGAVIDREGVGRSFAIACTLFARRKRDRRPGAVDAGGGASRGRSWASAPGSCSPCRWGSSRCRSPTRCGRGPSASTPRCGACPPWSARSLGAVLTATVGWRWVFWINLPMIFAVAWAAALALRGRPRPVSRASAGQLNLRRPRAARRDRGGPARGRPALAPSGGPGAAGGRARGRVRAGTSAVPRRRCSPTPPTRSPPTSPRSAPAPPSWAPRPTCRCSSRSASRTASTCPATRCRGAPGRRRAAAVHAGVDGRLDGRGPGQLAAAQPGPAGHRADVCRDRGDGHPGGRRSVPMIAYAFSGLGMGIASPALFAAVLADGVEGREGRRPRASR